jgi:xanthine dehydrogenase molybdopterin-binding subunit B
LFQGSTEGIAFIENIMEHIAKVLQKDPIEVRIKNLKNDDSTILNMIEDMKVTAEYEERKRNVEEFNRVSGAIYFAFVVFCELQCLGLLYRKYRNKILLSYCNI